MNLASEQTSELIRAELDNVLGQDRGRLLAALIHAVGDFDLAEEALSDAVEAALVHWSRSGVPNSPKGWLLQVGRRRAIDRLRKGQRVHAKTPDITRMMVEDEEARMCEPDELPDERLKLIFTCCHPALDEKSRIALTLRTVGGLSTREIARSFLDAEATMGQRLSRAKAKIGAAGIPYRVPSREEWGERLQSVLTVIYLIFNEGWTASAGDAPIRDTLCGEAVFLGRLMVELAPEEPEIEALLALMLLNWARRDARHRPGAGLVGLDEQDRQLWNEDALEEGLSLLDAAVARGLPGSFQCQAAIQALHVGADGFESTDWRQIAMLYDRLLSFQPTDVVRLNRAVAMAESGELDLAMREIEALAESLVAYQPYHAARAEVLRRRGDQKSANAAMERAIALS
ncbi:MAG: RNA polymerase, partial [Boseongicola sp.]|nr:RNA polymerase [Boseongicola sp.]